MSVAEMPASVATRRRAGSWGDGIGRGLWVLARWIIVGGSYLFLLSPLIVVMGASFHDAHAYVGVTFPPEGFTLRWFGEITEKQYESMALSVVLALAAALGACILGVPAALGVVRGNLPGKGLLLAVFRAPMQIPSIVIGVAFLNMYYIFGDITGLYVNGSLLGLYLGHLFVATPYVIGSVVAVLQRFNGRLEEAALSLGAGPVRTLWRVTLPVLLPGIYAGGLYAFMVSFSDVPVSMFLSSTGMVTYPVELFFGIENDFSPAVLASSTLVILFSLAMLLLAQRLVGLDAMLRSNR